MYLNTITSAKGSRKSKKRVGRGIGCTLGKTCGRGHKGQHARAGGYHKVGFEGGQMPLQRRLPKMGFKSVTQNMSFELRMSVLNKLRIETIDLSVLKENNLVPRNAKKIKIIDSGSLESKVNLRGIAATKNVAKKITDLGGSIVN